LLIVSVLKNYAREILSFISKMFDTNLPWNLDHHRYAVLGVPRSGTQLLEAFVKYSLTKRYDQVIDLQEIFTAQASLANTLVLENNRINVQDGSDVKVYDAMSASKKRLELIKQADMSQPLTCRVFLDNRMSSISFTDGIKYLQGLDFKFVYINRPFDHKILSALFAKESFIFSTYKNTMTLRIDIDELKSFIVARYLIEQQHLKVMKSLISEYHVVEYDTLAAKADCLSDEEKQQAFGIFKVKQLPLDPYEQVENSDEVKKVFTEFYPKLQELATSLL